VTDGPGTEGGADDGTGAERRRPVAPYIVLAVALVVGLMFVVLASSDKASNQESAATPLLGKAAPNVAGPTIDGGTFDLSSRRGNWVTLNFFNTTCVPCVNEHPELVKFAQQQSALGNGSQLVTVVWNQSGDPARTFFAENGGGWPAVVDTDGQIAFDYAVAQVPETWLIDPSGRVRAHYISQITADGLSAEIQQLRELDTAASG